MLIEYGRAHSQSIIFENILSNPDFIASEILKFRDVGFHVKLVGLTVAGEYRGSGLCSASSMFGVCPRTPAGPTKSPIRMAIAPSCRACALWRRWRMWCSFGREKLTQNLLAGAERIPAL